METRYLKLTFRQSRKGDPLSVRDKLKAAEERKRDSGFKRSQFHILRETQTRM